MVQVEGTDDDEEEEAEAEEEEAEEEAGEEDRKLGLLHVKTKENGQE